MGGTETFPAQQWTKKAMIGFWWDSRSLTRTLDEVKLLSYMTTLADYATRPTLTLKEMQSVAGKMQPEISTVQTIASRPPPGTAVVVTASTKLKDIVQPCSRAVVRCVARRRNPRGHAVARC